MKSFSRVAASLDSEKKKILQKSKDSLIAYYAKEKLNVEFTEISCWRDCL